MERRSHRRGFMRRFLAGLLLAACAGAPRPSVPSDGQPAPWLAHPPIAAARAPEVLLRQWSRAENRERCAPLTFATVPPDATPRAATFAGGWAVAWDQPGAKGTSADGQACATCGRSAFGIAGTGIGHGEGMYRAWEHQRSWSGGAWAGWGLEGGSGPRLLAYVVDPAQECLYNVWSSQSVEHLESLLLALRRVEVP